MDGLVAHCPNIQSYDYQENGYKAETARIKPQYPDTYSAGDDLPNGSAGQGYPVTDFGDTSTIVAVGFKSGGIAGEYDGFLFPVRVESYIGITASSNYAVLNQTQYTVTVKPTTFKANVNSTGKFTMVEPLMMDADLPDIDETGLISFNSANSLLITSLIYTSL
ncbi:hypothetical protein B0O99DRAFT_735314 [Bisporella sp. PMI_857]|nr:hypothetical protein B0O99DRAFT_735314 [Bisporella sp. PMI_857]